MLYHVKMTVNLPADMHPDEAADIKSRETAYSHRLQTEGIIRHIWRITGLYENISIFDCRDNAHLHEVLMGLPLRPHMTIDIMPLSQHPSSIRCGDL
ncbi:muconolactone Delta-isomerase [Pacificibacter marinus]|uniref:muconolactone Delta-isomerase n=1 Tax=Pacificibacter marinus TaxID=658057 RepID=UPI001C06F516|nr:muconolactone Delta-isomerase family protein [Pacificibacter marinus]MBU2867812.1 muconolactone Delta-isomerase family protein [Pacificibacter marinus]